MTDGQDEREPDEGTGYSRSPPRSPTTLYRWKTWPRIVIGLFITIGASASTANLYLEVREGRGGETYRSMWGYKVSPITILVTVGATLAVFPAISVVEWLLHRRDWALGRKFRRKRT